MGEHEKTPSAFEMAFGVADRHADAMDVDSVDAESAIRLDLTNWSKIPSHALPSTSVLCSNLLDQILDRNARTS